MMRFLYLLMLVPLTAAAGEHYATDDGPRAALQAYAHAAKLLPLRASDEGTLRLWTRDYMVGQVHGYIITKTTAKSCRASSSYANGSITVGRVRCRSIPKPTAIDEAIRALPAFSRQAWNCPAFDGGEVFLEGVRQHEYFAIRVGNPQACADPESKAVVDLLGRLG